MAADTPELSGWHFLRNMISVLAANGHGQTFRLVPIVVTATSGQKITSFQLPLAVPMTSAIFSHCAISATFASTQGPNNSFKLETGAE